MAIDRTVKFTVRLNMLNPAHVTINKVLNELNLDIFKSKNQAGGKGRSTSGSQ